LNGRRSSLPRVTPRSPNAGLGPRSPAEAGAERVSSPRALNGRRSSLPRVAPRSPNAGLVPRSPVEAEAERASSPRALNGRRSSPAPGSAPRAGVLSPGDDARGAPLAGAAAPRTGRSPSGGSARTGFRPAALPERTGERAGDAGRGCLAVSLTRINSQAAIARSSSVSTWIWVRLLERLLPSRRNTSSTRSPSVLIRAACTPIRCWARTRAIE